MKTDNINIDKWQKNMFKGWKNNVIKIPTAHIAIIYTTEKKKKK
jgi:hypothetical protein